MLLSRCIFTFLHQQTIKSIKSLEPRDIACYYLEKYKDVKFAANFQDGQIVKTGEKIITDAGNASSIFMVERVMLNYLQHLSAIATKTEKYVNQTIGTIVI